MFTRTKTKKQVKEDERGKYANHHRCSQEQRRGVIDHINSFPVIESHYCRAKTSKKYLEADLNIEKMYDLYVDQCKKENREFVKSSYYRSIFTTCFNIDFHIPKTDRCEKCEAIKMKRKENVAITVE